MNLNTHKHKKESAAQAMIVVHQQSAREGHQKQHLKDRKMSDVET